VFAQQMIQTGTDLFSTRDPLRNSPRHATTVGQRGSANDHTHEKPQKAPLGFYCTVGVYCSMELRARDGSTTDGRTQSSARNGHRHTDDGHSFIEQSIANDGAYTTDNGRR
jgi:hypothetical protein